VTSPSRRFLVLARRAYQEALAYQGVLEVASGEEPGAAATGQFGADWLELVLAPESAVHWVIQPQAPEPTA
jgi:hypothetical protein